MTITALPAVPSRSDAPATFISKADAFLAALPQFVTEANDTASALNLASVSDTSASSVLIGTGAKTFTVSAGKSFQGGMYLVIADTAAPSTNSMFAQVTSYSGTTLIVNVISVRGSGTKTAWEISLTSSGGAQSGANSDITSLTGLTSPITGVAANSKIQPITASVGSSALTITLNPTSLDFRDATLTSGTINTRTVSAAISCVVPSTATLGTVNAVQNRLAVLAIDNAGTVELAVVNLAGGNSLDETGVITTTALSTGSDSNNVIYSTTARTSVPYRVVGYVESTQATAGTWATAPSTIQGYGGQAFAAMSSLGYGQTWQVVTRTSGTTYYNTTGKPIFLSAEINGNVSSFSVATITINGVAFSLVRSQNSASASYGTGTAIIPTNATYVITDSLITSRTVYELR